MAANAYSSLKHFQPRNAVLAKRLSRISIQRVPSNPLQSASLVYIYAKQRKKGKVKWKRGGKKENLINPVHHVQTPCRNRYHWPASTHTATRHLLSDQLAKSRRVAPWPVSTPKKPAGMSEAYPGTHPKPSPGPPKASKWSKAT